MQIHIRGLRTHIIDCEESERIEQLKDRIAALEELHSDDFCLYAAGCPVSNDSLVIEFEDVDLVVSVRLLGGKVHGSLARAGKVRGQTPKVEKQEKKKKKTGRAKKRMQYNKRFVNVPTTNGKRPGPNSNSV